MSGNIDNTTSLCLSLTGCYGEDYLEFFTLHLAATLDKIPAPSLPLAKGKPTTAPYVEDSQLVKPALIPFHFLSRLFIVMSLSH